MQTKQSTHSPHVTRSQARLLCSGARQNRLMLPLPHGCTRPASAKGGHTKPPARTRHPLQEQQPPSEGHGGLAIGALPLRHLTLK